MQRDDMGLRMTRQQISLARNVLAPLIGMSLTSVLAALDDARELAINSVTLEPIRVSGDLVPEGAGSPHPDASRSNPLPPAGTGPTTSLGSD